MTIRDPHNYFGALWQSAPKCSEIVSHGQVASGNEFVSWQTPTRIVPTIGIRHCTQRLGVRIAAGVRWFKGIGYAMIGHALLSGIIKARPAVQCKQCLANWAFLLRYQRGQRSWHDGQGISPTSLPNRIFNPKQRELV